MPLPLFVYRNYPGHQWKMYKWWINGPDICHVGRDYVTLYYHDSVGDSPILSRKFAPVAWAMKVCTQLQAGSP